MNKHTIKFLIQIICLVLFSSAVQLQAETYYIDASSGSDRNEGTSRDTAWQSLEKVNETTFHPGDTIRFKRGETWFGQLKPNGSGAKGAPIVIRDYDNGPLPLIDGNGVTGEAVVYLFNQQYWEITNLEIVNPADEDGDRRGVWLSGSNCGVLNHLYLKGLHIHDIKGISGQSLEAKKTGGIYVAIQDDESVPSRWNDLRIEDCLIHDVRNSGITTQNETTKGIHDFSTETQEWYERRITNLYIGGNSIYNVSKNGIIVRLADGGLVEHNLLHDTAIGPDGKGMTGNTIFSRAARNTVFQFNEGYNNRSDNYDGCLYDADLNSPGTIWQYSYSHDNNHGLYWGCTVKEDAGIIVRYNISQNDKGGIFVVNYPTKSTYIYNNTVFIGAHRSPIILYERGKGKGSHRYYEFKNNLIYSESDTATFSFNLDPEEDYNRVISHNLFYGVEPPEFSTNHIVADPLLVNPGSGGTAIDFRNPSRLSGYRLQPGSPAIDAGIPIMKNGGRDFWGGALEDKKPDIGVQEFGSAPVNVIMLMADDLGWGDVGFNGNEKIITPHLDRMATSGMRFTNFYAAAPLCSPTRASVLTGRAPFRQGIFAAHTGGMRIAEKTIAEVLKSEGYATGFFGKWHLGWVEPDKIETRGFYSPPWHHGYEEVFATKSAVPTWNPTKTPPGWTSFGAEDDGSWGGSIYVHNGVPVTENLEGDDSRIIMDRAIPFIEASLDEGKPFLATVWFHTPHEPILAGPEYLAKYPGLPEEQQHLYGCITAMDDQIGRLKAFLEEKGIAGNTILLFCSDNGPADPQTKRGIASAGPFRGHKHQLWEGGLRVPSVIEWPGHIKPGQTSNFSSSTSDYFPTILDLLDISIPDKVPLDGISLAPVLKGKSIKRDLPIASGYLRHYRDTEIYAFIDGRYKIVQPEAGDEMMLFDLEKDPGESTDLSKKLPEVFERLKGELELVKASWFESYEGKDYQW